MELVKDEGGGPQQKNEPPLYQSANLATSIDRRKAYD